VAEVLASSVPAPDGPLGRVIDGSLLMRGALCHSSLDSANHSKICWLDDSLCPWERVDTEERVILDGYEKLRSGIQSVEGLFLFPIVSDEISTSNEVPRLFSLTQCLLLEPGPKVDGCFRRVGYFDVLSTPFENSLVEEDWVLHSRGGWSQGHSSGNCAHHQIPGHLILSSKDFSPPQSWKSNTIRNLTASINTRLRFCEEGRMSAHYFTLPTAKL
jgi:hypothetical protein